MWRLGEVEEARCGWGEGSRMVAKKVNSSRLREREAGVCWRTTCCQLQASIRFFRHSASTEHITNGFTTSQSFGYARTRGNQQLDGSGIISGQLIPAVF